MCFVSCFNRGVCFSDGGGASFLSVCVCGGGGGAPWGHQFWWGGEGLKKIVDGGCVETLGGRIFQKLSYLVGGGGWYQKSCQKEGITLKRGIGGGVDVEMGRCHFSITLQFNCIYCVQLQFGSSFFCVNHARFSSNSL